MLAGFSCMKTPNDKISHPLLWGGCMFVTGTLILFTTYCDFSKQKPVFTYIINDSSVIDKSEYHCPNCGMTIRTTVNNSENITGDDRKVNEIIWFCPNCGAEIRVDLKNS